MTLEEKLGQLNQLSAADYTSTPDSLAALIKRGEVGSLMDAIGADTTRALQRLAVERSRLHIPLLFADDVIHGFRTIFPIPLGEAASWDPPLAERSAHCRYRVGGERYRLDIRADGGRGPRSPVGTHHGRRR